MNKLIKQTLPASLLTVVGLISSAAAMAIQCPATVNFVELIAATQTVHITGVGFDATYSGENPVIIALMTEQAFQPDMVVTYTLDGTSCLGGNIQAAAF